MRKSALLIPLLFTDCVKKSTHEKALAENKRLQGELSETQKKLADTEQSLSARIKELEQKLGIVSEDSGVPSVRVRELAGAVASGARTFDTIEYSNEGEALQDLLLLFRQLTITFLADLVEDLIHPLLGDVRCFDIGSNI